MHFSGYDRRRVANGADWRGLGNLTTYSVVLVRIQTQ